MNSSKPIGKSVLDWFLNIRNCGHVTAVLCPNEGLFFTTLSNFYDVPPFSIRVGWVGATGCKYTDKHCFVLCSAFVGLQRWSVDLQYWSIAFQCWGIGLQSSGELKLKRIVVGALTLMLEH